MRQPSEEETPSEQAFAIRPAYSPLPSLPAWYAQEVVVEIGDNERGRFKIRWIWEDFPPTKH